MGRGCAARGIPAWLDAPWTAFPVCQSCAATRAGGVREVRATTRPCAASRSDDTMVDVDFQSTDWGEGSVTRAWYHLIVTDAWTPTQTKIVPLDRLAAALDP